MCLLAELVLCALYKLEFIQRYAYRAQHGLDDVLVIANSLLQQLPRRLHIVKVCMKVRKQDCHLENTKSIQPKRNRPLLYKYS